MPSAPATRMATNAVLLVSDDRETGGFWAHALHSIGLQATLVPSAAEALARWEQGPFDLVLIDVCGPDLDGIELARQLRAEAVNPILFFTPQGNEAHLLSAYQAGVDECVVKPVSPALFLAKVRAWLRRAWTVPTGALSCLHAGPLTLSPGRRAVVVEGGEPVRLTNLEFRLLHLLMSHAGRPLPADLILDRVWGCSDGDGALLKNVVYRLRRKIEPDPSHPRYLQTEAGGGYVLVP